MAETKDVTCAKHGPYRSTLMSGGIWAPCMLCHDEEVAAFRSAEAQQERVRRGLPMYSRLMLSGIPPRYREKSFDSFDIDDHPERQRALAAFLQYDALLESQTTDGRNLLVSGPPGTGKTHLACALVRSLLESSPKLQAHYVSIGNLFRRFKATWDRGAKESETAVLAFYAGLDLLVVDELGVQFGSQTEQNLFFDVVNSRYERMKPSVVCSNLVGDGLAKLVGDRTFDRLRGERSIVVSMDWQSAR